jgi:predicted ester cyclase
VVARRAIDAVNEAMSTGETSAIDVIFASNVAGHPPHRSLVTGEPFSHDLAGLKAGLADIRLFIPDAAITIDDLITSGDTVAARVTFRGTPNAAALGLGEAASQPLEIGGLMYGRIANGRVAEFWVYFDLSTYIELVGSLPPAVMATPTGGS